MYEMKDEYLTGVPIIDDEHRRLFELTNQAYALLNEEFIPDKFDNIITLINELKDYSIQHFADEEEYMESIQYKRLFTQKIEHSKFVEKLNEVNLDDIDENQDQAILAILDFLTDWLIHHIVENDVLIGKA